MAESTYNQNDEGAKEYTPLKEQTEEEAPAKNLYLVRGHNFNLYTFKQPTYCSLCDKFLWGMFKQGYSCIECRMAVHRRCYANVVGKCLLAKGGEDDNDNQTEDASVGKAHTFEVKTFKTPTFCCHCGSLLWGCCSQGLKCKECKSNVHHKCKERAVYVCGVNQKAVIMEEDTPADANENNEDNKENGEKEDDKEDEERQADEKKGEDEEKPDENSEKPAEESEKVESGDSSKPEASEKVEE